MTITVLSTQAGMVHAKYANKELAERARRFFDLDGAHNWLISYSEECEPYPWLLRCVPKR